MRRAIKRITVALMCVSLAATACTRVKPIAVSSVDGAEVWPGEVYRITTVKGDAYVTNHVESSDSELVIRTQQRLVEDQKHWDFVAVEPVVIPFGEVATIEQIKPSHRRFGAVATIGLVAVFVSVVLLLGANAVAPSS